MTLFGKLAKFLACRGGAKRARPDWGDRAKMCTARILLSVQLTTFPIALTIQVDRPARPC
ncbi:MAG: hypothetical protein MUE44_02215 [Oscillatoriaceae cyanobacterium Prado104]|nr:hypothetical protein [Oscillatoriaceae cyanobacterium Prado104]